MSPRRAWRHVVLVFVKGAAWKAGRAPTLAGQSRLPDQFCRAASLPRHRGAMLRIDKGEGRSRGKASSCSSCRSNIPKCDCPHWGDAPSNQRRLDGARVGLRRAPIARCLLIPEPSPGQLHRCHQPPRASAIDPQRSARSLPDCSPRPAPTRSRALPDEMFDASSRFE